MKTPDWKTCTEEELWRYVAWHLNAQGIESVLVGGSVAAIYSQGAYRSGDLDFIISDADRIRIDQILTGLGFCKEGRHFRHPQCKHLFVEFPPGPLAIGNDYRIKPVTVSVEKRKLLILSPTDCVCDRLASYMFFKSRDALEQALMVAAAQPVDLKKIKSWCTAEGGIEQFDEFRSLLKDRKSR